MQSLQQDELGMPEEPKVSYWGRVYSWVMMGWCSLMGMILIALFLFPILSPILIISGLVFDFVLLGLDLFIKTVWLKKRKGLFLMGWVLLVVTMYEIGYPIFKLEMSGTWLQAGTIMIVAGIGYLIYGRRLIWDNWPAPKIKPKRANEESSTQDYGQSTIGLSYPEDR